MIPELGCDSPSLWKASSAISVPGSPLAPPCVLCPFSWLGVLSELILGDAFFGGSQLLTKKKTSVSSFPP